MTDFPVLPGLTLRIVTTADQLFLDALYRSTRVDLQHAGLEPAMLATLVQMQQQVHERGQRAAFPHARHALIERAGEAIGRVIVDADARHGMRVLDIALLPQARNSGHGSAVLRALQVQAGALGLPLRLRVAKDNPDAARLYRSLGFTLEAAGDAHDELVWLARQWA